VYITRLPIIALCWPKALNVKYIGIDTGTSIGSQQLAYHNRHYVEKVSIVANTSGAPSLVERECKADEH